MNLGLVSDSLRHMALEDMLDTAAHLGLSGVEFNTGGWSDKRHVDVARLLDDTGALDCFRRAIASRGLEISVLNACGNPLHPADRSQADSLVDTLRLAGELGVETVVTHSGLPAGNPTDTAPNWITSTWAEESRKALRYQWEEVLFPFWSGIVAVAKENGVRRIAVSMHPNQCVHNVPTLLELREAIGPQIGANLNPSRLLLMGADPIRAISALGDALYSVHAGDLQFNPEVQSTTSLIDTGHLSDLDQRAWSFATPGYGQDGDWWARFCHRLTMVGYDDWVSIVHEDLVLDPLDGLHKAAQLLKSVNPRKHSHTPFARLSG